MRNGSYQKGEPRESPGEEVRDKSTTASLSWNLGALHSDLLAMKLLGEAKRNRRFVFPILLWLFRRAPRYTKCVSLCKRRSFMGGLIYIPIRDRHLRIPYPCRLMLPVKLQYSTVYTCLSLLKT
jgi:hypothetical protein